MKPSLGIWLVRPESENLALRLQKRLGGSLYLPWLNSATPQKDQFASAYRGHKQWVMLAASGIAVRFLDGLTHDKHHDPGVVVVDEAGRFAVSLLAGHEGGANQLAYRVANAVGAVPVVSTATEALKPLVLGIGCRKGVSLEAIMAAITLALANRDIEEIRELVTVEIKAKEAGLLAFCALHAIPMRILACATVAGRAWLSQPSDWVQQNIGLPGVCEPCALIASPRGRLIVPKLTLNGVAVAIVEDDYGIS
ncbi:MAG: cobalamin biosynthesis protein [Methylococcaceae bacterium]|jgi:cobalt-precorrin 5A hydrolase